MWAVVHPERRLVFVVPVCDRDGGKVLAERRACVGASASELGRASPDRMTAGYWSLTACRPRPSAGAIVAGLLVPC
jgi:hypothetical protein